MLALRPHRSLLVLVLLLSCAVGRTAEPVPWDPPRGELRLVVFGDFNGPYGSLDYPAPVARTVRAVARVWRPDLVLSPGDVVAGQDRTLPTERLNAMWAAFDAQVAAPLREAGVPYAVAIGNHDGSGLRDGDGDYLFARERRAATAYWSQPMYRANLAYVDREAAPFRYSFRMGDAFVAVLDASTATIDAAQRAWLTDTLRTRQASEARLRIVVGHLPLFAVAAGKDRPGEVVSDGEALRVLLEELRVDTYVSGHHAAYYPGRRGGLELLFAGGVGARALLGDSGPPRSAVTVVDVWYQPFRVRYTSFDPSDMERIPASELPATIDGLGGRVERSSRGDP